MKLFVGYQLCANDFFLNTILQNAASINEVYFSWGSAPSGRSAVGLGQGLLPFEREELQRRQLKQIADAGIGLNLLLNANCYGGQSLARKFYQESGDLVDYLQQNMNLVSVTTTSPVMGRFLRDNFPNLEIKASVNMEIGTVEGMEYVKDSFDAFYLKRELNRNIPAIAPLRSWCNNHGKKLHILANSGCLNHCSARQFHDNLVAHEQEIAGMDNAFVFRSACREFLNSAENRQNYLRYSNWIRPEDLHRFEGIADGVKIATRISPNPAQILLAYLQGSFTGNILELLEPNYAQSFYPEVLNSHTFPKDYFDIRHFCSGKCETCGYCEQVYRGSTAQVSDLYFDENDINQEVN